MAKGKWQERWGQRIAWWLPRWLVYWCAIRLIAYATQGKFASQIVVKLTAIEALRRWE